MKKCRFICRGAVGTTSVKVCSKFKLRHSITCISNCHLLNRGHFIQAEFCQPHEDTVLQVVKWIVLHECQPFSDLYSTPQEIGTFYALWSFTTGQFYQSSGVASLQHGWLYCCQWNNPEEYGNYAAQIHQEPLYHHNKTAWIFCGIKSINSIPRGSILSERDKRIITHFIAYTVYKANFLFSFYVTNVVPASGAAIYVCVVKLPDFAMINSSHTYSYGISIRICSMNI